MRTFGRASGRAPAHAYGKVRHLSYGWWVALTGMVNMVFTSGPTFQGSGAILLAIESEFGWSRAVIGGVASFGRFGGTLFGPFEGYLTDKLGSARMMLYGLTLGGIGFILLSQIHGVLTYYFAFLVLSLGFSMGGFVPAITAVNKWLPRRRATGIALVVGGSSLGGLVVPALAWGISEHGWRTTTLWIGIVSIAIAPLFYLALTWRRPSQTPDIQAPRRADARPGREPAQQVTRSSPFDFTARQALHTRAFWIITSTHSLINFSTAAVSAHLLLHLNDIGIDTITAATIIPIMAVVAFTFQMAGGLIGDKFEKRYPISIFAAIQGTGVLILAFTTSYTMAVLFAVVWGIGFGGRTPILHALRGDYFGTKAFATILGMSSMMMGASMAIAPFAVGLAFDIQDTYRWAFISLAFLAFGASGLILFVSPPVHPVAGEPPLSQQ
ncbi:MAG: MFS transporter [Chloroflexi bacterium]|nr:MFS transporter [Chloroflexota bacterium]